MMISISIRKGFLLIAISAMLIGCGSQKQKEDDPRLRVVTTTGMIGDAVRMIAGDRVSWSSMMGPGVDPHLYKATKGDIDRFYTAELILYNGLNLEAKLTDVFEKMARNKRTVAVCGKVPDSLLRFPAAFAGHPDPHLWFDLSLWSNAVIATGAALASLDSVNAKLYDRNTTALLDSLGNLHEWIKAEVQKIPVDQRVLVTAHDAFGYFGRAYGLEVKGLQGISTVTEAGLYDITAMVDLLVAGKIKAVFVESSVPRKSIEAVVEGCRARGHEIVIGGELFSDAMGQAGTPEGTYFGMVRHNVNTIVQALK